MRRIPVSLRSDVSRDTGLGRRCARLGAILALLAAAGLAGCSTAREPTVTGSVPDNGYSTRHPILIKESIETMDVPVGSQSGHLTSRMANTVSAFGAEAMERGATGVTILIPSGSANETSADAMSRQIASALVSGGVPAKAISHQPYQVEANAADAPIRLAYPRVAATVPHACGQWPEQMMIDNSNRDYFNFGCAHQSNIAAMVVNPSDLVTPQGTTAVDANRRTRVLTNYRNGAATKSAISAPNSSPSGTGGGN